MTDPAMQAVVQSAARALSQAARQYTPGVRIRDEGSVVSAADGVLRIRGLPGAAFEEVLHVGTGQRAMVLGLEREAIHAVLLGDPRRAREGAPVRSSGEVAQTRVGDALLGRVVDPLGRALDGLPEPVTRSMSPLQRRAPQIHERAHIHRPMYTGVLAVDAMFPIGRGQRQLLLGDDGTGKTSIALDALVRQRDTGVVCVYVGIGRRRDEIRRIHHALQRAGGRFIVVAAPQDESPGQRYLAPYAGCAMAEYFMERGEDALIVYDDLSAHAVAWRELSLLMRRPPGREAYPGDIFYQHARLLERATQLSPERGGGSLTALPIAVLEGGRVSAYIPTNLISITDGQLVLSHELFAAGHKPAIVAGLSVSRVGGKAQPQAIAALAGKLRLQFAAFLELEGFARLGTRLEPSAQRRLEHGRRVRRLLRAPRLAPLSLFQEVVRLLLLNQAELLLRIPVSEIEVAAVELCDALERRLPALAERVERDAVLQEADRRAMSSILTELIEARFGAA